MQRFYLNGQNHKDFSFHFEGIYLLQTEKKNIHNVTHLNVSG